MDRSDGVQFDFPDLHPVDIDAELIVGDRGPVSASDEECGEFELVIQIEIRGGGNLLDGRGHHVEDGLHQKAISKRDGRSLRSKHSRNSYILQR